LFAQNVGEIKNLRIVDVNITAGDYSDNIGGLCGSNQNTISNCSVTGSVTGGVEFIGGLCGYNYGGTIRNCRANISVCGGDNTDSMSIGGLCGENVGSVIKCQASASATSGKSSTFIGGLCGYNSSDTTITKCYATGSVSGGGSDLGGICGYNNGGTISACYFLDPSDGGGPDNGIGSPLADEAMKQQSSFSGWGFVDDWNIGEGQSLPLFASASDR